MKQKLLLFFLLILCVCFGYSQEMGKFGFFFKAGSGSSVGLAFNLSDRVTLRPSFGFYDYNEESESSKPDLKYKSYSVDLGLFYHFLKKDHLTVYTGLEAGYVYQNREPETWAAISPSLGPEKSRGYRGNLIFGLQYNFNKHLAVFGEFGFGFLTEKVDVESSLAHSGITKSTKWGLRRSGFGIILYL